MNDTRKIQEASTEVDKNTDRVQDNGSEMTNDNSNATVGIGDISELERNRVISPRDLMKHLKRVRSTNVTPVKAPKQKKLGRGFQPPTTR